MNLTTGEQTIEFLAIWDAVTLTVRHLNESIFYIVYNIKIKRVKDPGTLGLLESKIFIHRESIHYIDGI